MLKNTTNNQILLSNLDVAKSFWSRSKGLLGTKSLSENAGLWILRCNSIHTFFMNYPIDCIFVDSKLKVVSLVENIKPGRMVIPQWKANSVIEVTAGFIEKKNINLGDVLYVGD